jgi:hypothetical protein
MSVTRLLACAVVLAGVAAPAAGAHGRVIINAALESLRSGDPLYVDPAAIPTLETGEATTLRQRIAAAGQPIYVAVLPADAQHELATADAVLQAVVDGLGVQGTYAVVVGGQFRTTSTELAPARTAALERRLAEQTSHEGPGAGLTAFVEEVAADEDGGGWSVSWTLAALLPVFALLAVLATLVRARRRSSVG